MLAAVAWLLLCGAATDEPVGRREFSRRFDTRRVQHVFSAELSGNAAQAGDCELRIRMTSALSGNGQGKAARAGLINGYVALSLPAGVEPAGDLRLYSSSRPGTEQLLYSAAYPPLARFADLPEPDLRLAGSGQLFEYFSATARVLDPAASVFMPVDSALRTLGGPAADSSMRYCAWTLPVDMKQRRLVDLFDPDFSGSAPEIIARLKLRISQPAPAGALHLYAGALSVAAAVVEAPSSLMPPGALALHELDPRRYSAPLPPAPVAADQDKGVAVGSPEPSIPMLVYSAEWLSWEDSLALAEIPHPSGGNTSAELPRVDGRAAQPPSAAPVRQAVADLGHAGEGTAPPSPPEAIQSGEESGPSGGSTARQVEVGTLPAPGGDGEIALKPITGSAGQRASQGETPFGASASGATLPPQVGYAGSTPGSTRFYGPGGPDNVHGGGPAIPPVAAPGLGTMVLVPAGDFLMGTDAGTPYGDADELPQHKVYLPDYLIDKYPVTNRQFGEFCVLAGYQAEGDWQRYSNPGVLDMPVRNVSWNDANAYAKWAGKRLPTEAEWEKAARGTDGRLFPWGNDWNADILPRGEFSYPLLSAPKAASPYGAMAMVGLLWQWTATPWHEYPFNPQARGDKLILRGGAFSNGRNIVRCANRYFEPPQVALNTFGFRCVKDKQ
jgi:formylglycine-generating enzyme required for sulfatase activity